MSATLRGVVALGAALTMGIAATSMASAHEHHHHHYRHYHHYYRSYDYPGYRYHPYYGRSYGYPNYYYTPGITFSLPLFGEFGEDEDDE